MNILTNNGKANFVAPLLSTMCPSQKMQFHQATAPMKNFIGNKIIQSQNTSRLFKNPNLFNQNTHGKDIPSSYRKVNHSEVKQDEELEKSPNFSEMVAEGVDVVDFGKNIMVGSPKSSCGVLSQKRSRTNNIKRKIPEKHNQHRQDLKELMELDISNDSADNSSIMNPEDQEMNENHCGSLKLCDLIVFPTLSSPVCVPTIELTMGSSKMSSPTTCIAFSVSPPTRRQRQISTGSEDSFIVFDSGTDEECDFSEDACSETDEGSDSGESDQDSKDESDVDSPGSVIIPNKKVRFAEDEKLCEIHPMIQWSYAYQAARKGPWEVYVRDRERFKNRIRLTGEKIGHCFEPEHRQKIYDQRMKENMDE